MNILFGYMVLFIMIILYILLHKKENYKRQRRRGIRGGWRRTGKSGHTVALKGTRYPKFPTITDEQYSLGDYDLPQVSELRSSLYE